MMTLRLFGAAATLLVCGCASAISGSGDSIARQKQLSSVPGSPRTVAVMPFVFSGSDTSLRPLERGFAELVATDLSRSAQLTILERERLQALLAEMKIGQSVDATSAGRAGRI